MRLRTSINVGGLSLTFGKLDKGQIDLKENVQGEWAGGREYGTLAEVGGKGYIPVGVAGMLNREGQLCSFGLVAVTEPKK